jgi:hypothetical protein
MRNIEPKDEPLIDKLLSIPIWNETFLTYTVHSSLGDQVQKTFSLYRTSVRLDKKNATFFPVIQSDLWKKEWKERGNATD